MSLGIRLLTRGERVQAQIGGICYAFMSMELFYYGYWLPGALIAVVPYTLALTLDFDTKRRLVEAAHQERLAAEREARMREVTGRNDEGKD